MRNKFVEETYLPKDQRKTILLASDDLRMPSGIGTMSREFVINTAQRYNWVQIGGAIQHPEKGKMVDLSQSINEFLGINDASVTIYPMDGYGDQDLVRYLINQHKVSAMLHFTDPRFWIWLYQMEHELRQKTPLLFYSIWDDLPYPMYNAPYYESCDWIGAISKQTYNIIKNVWTINAPKDWQVKYVPHGVPHDQFFPIEPTNLEHFSRMLEIRRNLTNNIDTEFIVMWNSRNIRRKLVTNIILAFKQFVDALPAHKRNKCLLVLHTQPVDENGTDLPALISALSPDIRIHISSAKIENKDLNCLYNIADVSINMSNAEGFGLGTCESVMAGTPIIATVTGGLQDQMRFEDEDGKWVNFSPDYPSNHTGRYKKCGDWAFPLFPNVRSLTGSPLTPYIFEDFVRWEDAALVINDAYKLGREELKRRGMKGREWMVSDEANMSSIGMAKGIISGIDTTLQNWKSRKRFTVFNANAGLKALETRSFAQHTGIIT